MFWFKKGGGDQVEGIPVLHGEMVLDKSRLAVVVVMKNGKVLEKT